MITASHPPFHHHSAAIRPRYDHRPPTLRVYANLLLAVALQLKQAVRVATRYAPAPAPVGAPSPRAPPSRRKVAVVSHAHYVLTVTAAPASRDKSALSEAA